MSGYAASNILNYHPEVCALVCISGFISVETFLKSMDSEYEEIYEFEQKMNPKYVNLNALDAIKDKNISMLFIHSTDDMIVPYCSNFQYLKEHINQKNIEFLTVTKKGHNPEYKESGVKYMQDEFKKLFSLSGNERIAYSKTIVFGFIETSQTI